MSGKQASVADRLFDNAIPEPNSGCWIWIGGLVSGRYGQFTWSTGNRILAHRASWAAHKGEIPEGLVVCHKCDVTTCVNPDHLFLGTQKDNVNDMFQKGRQVRHRGSRHGRAKLTEEQIKGIIADLRNGKGQQSLALAHGVCRSTIHSIKTGRNWRHLSEPA